MLGLLLGRKCRADAVRYGLDVSGDGEVRSKKCDNSLVMKSHYKGGAIFAAISVSWSGRLSPLFYDQATVQE